MRKESDKEFFHIFSLKKKEEKRLLKQIRTKDEKLYSPYNYIKWKTYWFTFPIENQVCRWDYKRVIYYKPLKSRKL